MPMISETSLNLIEFDKVLGMASSYARSAATAAAIAALRPLGDPQEIAIRRNEVDETRRMRALGKGLCISAFEDISDAVRKSLPAGAVLDPADLARFIPVLSMARDLSLLPAGLEGFTAIPSLLITLTGFPELLKVLVRTVDAEGNILDSASSELAALRREISRSEAAIQKRLSEIVRDADVGIFLQDTFITKRGGRWVIPVRMDSKGQIPGVLHDVSKSGETAFVEPIEIIHLSNELENLAAEARAEELRILRAVTAAVRENSEGLGAECRTLIHLDLVDSIGLFADSMTMEPVAVSEYGALRLVRARHPLLAAARTRIGQGTDVVPLDVSLGGDNTVMVITGSNAGGKTVAIKTIGLLIAMGLSGMPLPADASSTIPLAVDLLIDMGDEQSIEASLSTFSAHVTNIARILQRAGKGTVALIDELGTGTDPDEGAAIACAVLHELRKSGALVFATTHLTGIKGFVQGSAGMVNASMEFDRKTLSPLYRLRMGEPGRSHALEIARKYGLPESVVETARGMLSGVKVEFERLLDEAEERRRAADALMRCLEERQREIEERERKVSLMMAEAEAEKRRMLEKAYHDALELVTNTKRSMNLRLDELKHADRKALKQQIREAEKAAAELSSAAAELVRDLPGMNLGSVRAGDVVHIRSLGYDATVVEHLPKTGRLRVRAGAIEIEVPASDAMPGQGKVVFHGSRQRTEPLSSDAEAASSLRLIGKRVDESLALLEPFLNHAALAGTREVVIIHGVGKGLLSRAVREHLKGHPLVHSYRSGESSEGGAGVTVVRLSGEPSS
ncbi:MAG: endonuclease MutS2 [Thermodesulfovibrionales bacterium]